MANRFLNNIRINDAYTFPASDGNDGQVITTDGAGNLAFENVSPDAASVIYRDNFTGDGSTVTFDLQNSITDEDQTQIYIDGVYQEKSTYSISGTTITFTTAPILGHSVEVISISSINTGPTVLYQDNFTGNGNDTAFTLGQIIDNEIKTFIFLNGVYQFKNTYTVDGTTLTFDTAPANGVAIEVVSIASAVQSDSLEAGSVIIPVKNTHTASISKGTPVYITGNVGASERLQIAPADASNSAKMPSAGLLLTTLAVNEEGYVITGGYLRNLTTDTIDGTSTSSNDTVYVKPGGGLTMTKPTGSNLIQNVAKVARSASANSGSLLVSSILRTNDVPNLTTGKIWVGDSNTVESTVIHLDESNNRLGINNNSPNYSLDVTGDANISSNVIIGGNLTVDGTQTILNTQTVEVEDNILQLNTTQGSPDTATATTSGISVYRGDGVTQASFIFDDADDTWDLTNNLVVDGNATFAGAITGTSASLTTSGTVLSLDRTGGATALIELKIGGTVEGYLGANSTKSLIVYNESAAEKFSISNTGNATFTGDVTVTGGDITLGTDSIASNINAVGDVLAFKVDSNENTGGAPNIQFKVGSATELTINGSNATFAGNVGIGTTTNISSPLTVQTDGSANSISIIGRDNGASDEAIISFYEYDGTTRNSYILKDGGNLVIATGTGGSPSERMRITSAGQVQVGYYNTARGGVNTTFMTGKSGTTYLELNGGDTSGEGGLLFADGSGGNYGLVNYSHASDIMQFYTASGERMRIDSSGYIKTPADKRISVGDWDNSGLTAGAAFGFSVQSTSPGLFLTETDQTSRKGFVAMLGGGMYIGGSVDFIALDANNGNRAVTINSSLNVGIGTTSPTNGKLEVQQTATTAALWVQTGGTTDSYTIADFRTGTNASALAIKGNGRVGIGTTNPLELLNVHQTTATAGLYMPISIAGARYQADYAVGIAFRPENNSSAYAAKTAIVGSGGGYGYNMADLHFCFNNSTTITDEVSLSDAKVTMKRSGNVGIGTTSPTAKLDVRNDDGVGNGLHLIGDFSRAGGADAQLILGYFANGSAVTGPVIYAANGMPLLFSAGSVERMRITSGGRVLINNTNTSNDAMCHIGGNASNYALYLYADVVYAGGYRYQRFRSGGNIAGGIEGSNQTSVTYNTSSDYRMKKNIKPLENGLDRVCKLKPVKFNWKLNNELTEGFIAHEVQEIFPYAVTGEKDGENMQGMDYGRITPLLVKAIQELKAEIETLKTQING